MGNFFVQYSLVFVCIFVAAVFVHVKVILITVENLNTEKSATQFC